MFKTHDFDDKAYRQPWPSRPTTTSHPNHECVLNFQERVLLRTEHFFVIEDFPSRGIARPSPTARVRTGSPDAGGQGALPAVLDLAKAWIEERHQPDGYNVGMNCGEAAGQTVMHFHYLIPRTHGDTPRPRGGVRGVIPSKQSLKTVSVINAQRRSGFLTTASRSFELGRTPDEFCLRTRFSTNTDQILTPCHQSRVVFRLRSR